MIILFYLVFVWGLVYFGSLYFGLYHLGIKKKASRIISMLIKEIPPHLIVNNLLFAHKKGIKISIDEMEAHHLAGGNVANVVEGIIKAKSRGLILPFGKAAKADLLGLNVSIKVKYEIETKGIDNLKNHTQQQV